MYKHVFGPVPSRRLGKSLGVDIVTPKSCNLNCVFCECGATASLTLKRQSFKDVEEIKNEILSVLKEVVPDFITFSGSGEPTLSSDLGLLIDFIKKNTPCKVAVITNSLLLKNDEVIKDIQNADVIIPTINTTEQDIFEKIVRPDKDEKVEDVLRGLTKLSTSNFKGKIFLETFILESVNDNQNQIEKLAEFIKSLRYDKLQLNTLARPGAVRELRPVPLARMLEIKKILEDKGLHDVEVIKDLKEDEEKIEANPELIENMKKKRSYKQEEIDKIFKKTE